MQKVDVHGYNRKRNKKRIKNKIRIIILNILVAISITCITLFFLLLKSLSTDGLILAAIIDIPCAIFLILMCLANGVFDIPKKPKKKNTVNDLYNVQFTRNKKRHHRPRHKIHQIERF